LKNVELNTKTEAGSRFDVEQVRKDFPILDVQVHGKHLCYFDNAATTQKPQVVIDTINNYYNKINSNIHRGVHTLSEAATSAYEQSRIKVQKFLNAESEKEIVFTAGTTASINLVTQTFGRQNIGEGDEIIISHMEHHSNIVPWQLLAKEKKAILKVIPISDAGELDIEAYKKLVTDRTKIVSVVYVSNSLGTINPVKDIIEYAHSFRIPVLIDAAQAVNHFPVNVKELDCDFLALSGHKLFGPTGIGVLYGKEDLLESMPPYMGGGDMISKVTFEETTFNELPHKFEAGTPHIEGVIGLGAAIDYLNNTGLGNISAYESELYEYTYKAISSIKGLNIIGTAQNRCSVISFTLDNVHPHDVGTFLDFEGIAIRTGHHCTQPVMQRFNIPATSRVSLAFYNTKEEVDILVNGIKKVIEVFG